MRYVRSEKVTCLSCTCAARLAAGPAEPNIFPASEKCSVGCLAMSLDWGSAFMRLAALGYSTVSVCKDVTCMAVGLLKDEVLADLSWSETAEARGPGSGLSSW